ncbi:MAG TPA: glycosyltransferase family 2 protein [Puia sp.]|nr:glycosyltransferase family 2 protein [Puia sp.]
MQKCLNEKRWNFEWIGESPFGESKKALLIPLYNESGSDFEARLGYFDSVAREFCQELDVIIIDDGSSDDSLEAMKRYKEKNQALFYITSVFPNGQKVGALFLTALHISHDIVVLSDFDTQLVGIEKLFGESKSCLYDSNFMGCYFRMLPFDGNGNIFEFQQLEYSIERSIYKFHRKEHTIRVMPGAGSCYKREVLLDIYSAHSGLRSGEDREATIIGLKLGYKVLYLENVLALTKPPSSFKSLVRQRIRWNLGYIETFYKELSYYLQEIRRMSVVGRITLIDLLVVILMILLPYLIFALGVWDFQKLLVFIASIYFLKILWCLYLLSVSPAESREFKHKRLSVIIAYPFIKISLDSIAWTGAVIKFVRNWRLSRKNPG